MVEVKHFQNYHFELPFSENKYCVPVACFFSRTNAQLRQIAVLRVCERACPGAHCIKLLPEKNSGYFNLSFFSYGKVNGKNHANLSFQILPEFSLVKVLCNGPQLLREIYDLRNVWLLGYLRMRQVFRRQVFRKG